MNNIFYYFDCDSGVFIDSKPIELNQWGEEISYPNTTKTPPLEAKDGFASAWNRDKQAWSYIENHKDEEGFVNGEAFTITDYGPYPDGWSKEALPPTLEEAKKTAEDALKTYRQGIEYGGFMYNGQRWDSEQKDELRLNSAYKVFEAGLTEYPGWKIGDGAYITLTPEILAGASMALMQHYGHAFSVEATKLGEIQAFKKSEKVLDWVETKLKTDWEAPINE